MTIAEKYAQQYQPNGEVSLADLIQAAVDEQAETHAMELRAYEATVAELTRRVDEAQSVPVVGEPTDAAYKWMIANGVEPLTSLHKLGERLAAFLDEDQFSGCETLLLTAITAINTFVPVPAAELATLREKAAMADELRKDAERLPALEHTLRHLGRELAKLDKYRLCMSYNDSYFGEPVGTVKRVVVELRHCIDAAIAQGKGE